MRRLIERFGDAASSRLAINASALMASSVGTGLLGLVYWIVAEHTFPTAEVGRASAVISSATVLSSLACLSLGGAFQRFLPIAGGKSLRYVLGGYLVTTTAALALAAGFVAFGFGDRILHTHLERLGFVAMVVVLALYALTDPILTGLRRAPAVAVKNITLSAIKIVPLVLLAGVPSIFAIAGSWALLAAAITAVFMFHVIRIVVGRRGTDSSQLPTGRELLSFQGAFFMMMIVGSLIPLSLPLIVVAEVGTTQNAYFNLAWTMCSAAGLLRSGLGSAFIVEASLPGADRGALLRRLGKMLGVVTALTAIGIAVGGPLVLWVAGPDYLRSAGPLMLVMALDSIVETCVVSYFLIAQLQRRMRLVVIAQVIMVVITVGATYLLVHPMGLIGVGIASLLAASVTLVIVARPLVVGIRAMLAASPAESAMSQA